MIAPTAPSATLPSPPEAPDSLQARLRAKRMRQAMQRRRVFDLPGYDGLVGAKLAQADEEGVIADANVMLGEESATAEDAPKLFDARRHTIARACIEIVVRDQVDGEWRPLHREAGQEAALGPVRFDERLVAYLSQGEEAAGEGPRSATECVKWVMSSALPFIGLYAVYSQWSGLESALEDDELVGESSAAR